MNLNTSKLSAIFLFIALAGFNSTLDAQSTFDQGTKLFEAGELDEAKSFFSKYLKSNRKDAEANFYMGRIYFDKGDFSEATDWFNKAVDYQEGNAKYHMWLGHSYGSRAQDAPTIKQPFLARNSRKKL